MRKLLRDPTQAFRYIDKGQFLVLLTTDVEKISTAAEFLPLIPVILEFFENLKNKEKFIRLKKKLFNLLYFRSLIFIFLCFLFNFLFILGVIYSHDLGPHLLLERDGSLWVSGNADLLCLSLCFDRSEQRS